MSTDRLQVLLVLNELTRSGAPLLALSTFRALQEQVALSTVANRGGPLEDDFRDLGPLTVLHEGPVTRLLRRTSGEDAASTWGGIQGRAWSRVAQAPFRRSRPDVLYLNSVASLPVVNRLPWVRRLKAPTLLHVHETGVLLDRFAALSHGLLTSLPDRYVAVSDDVATTLSSRHGVDPADVAVIHPHVDDRWLRADHGPRKEPHEPIVIGGAGNPTWTKGPELWLRTARTLLERSGAGAYRFEWLGANDTIEADQMRAMIGKLGLQDEVTLLPTSDDPMGAFSRWDVLLMSSWEESASLVTLEMMALGKLVVCIRGTGGTAELVGDAGVVVDGFSPQLLTQAIHDATSDPVCLEDIGEKAAVRVAERFAVAVKAPVLLQEIRSVADLAES